MIPGYIPLPTSKTPQDIPPFAKLENVHQRCNFSFLTIFWPTLESFTNPENTLMIFLFLFVFRSVGRSDSRKIFFGIVQACLRMVGSFGRQRMEETAGQIRSVVASTGKQVKEKKNEIERINLDFLKADKERE